MGITHRSRIHVSFPTGRASRSRRPFIPLALTAIVTNRGEKGKDKPRHQRRATVRETPRTEEEVESRRIGNSLPMQIAPYDVWRGVRVALPKSSGMHRTPREAD